MFDYSSLQALADEATKRKIKISELVLEDQSQSIGVSKEQILKTMEDDIDVMEKSAKEGGKEDIRSNSGLTGGDGYRMYTYSKKGESLSGSYSSCAIATAISVAECNAAMGKIVASPTAGSCGVLPGALLPLMWEGRISKTEAAMALLCAGGIGMVIASTASIAGAEGGCQAECGSAASMAAGALTELMGGTPDMVVSAVAIAIKNQLGLVCDPVAGLVEVPCIKRNAGSVMCAITACDMALSGIKTVIPADEVIAAMREVGDEMAVSLKETAKGGLAASKTGRSISEKLFK